MIAFARGKERGAKRESVDFAFDAKPAANTPDFRNVKGDANDHPTEIRLHALERGFEGFLDGFGLRLHGGPCKRGMSEAKRGHAGTCPAYFKSAGSKPQNYFEKLATASASVLNTSKTVSNLVICRTSWNLLPK